MSVFVWTLGDVVLVACVVLSFIGLVVVLGLQAFEQWRCKHLNYFENQACDAICRKCGKNLGFIGVVRATKGKP